MYFKTLNTFALRFLNERRISTERRKLLSRLTTYLCHRFSRQNKVVVFFRPHYWLFWRHFYKRISNRWRFTVVQALVSKKYCVGRGQSTSKERRKLYFNSSNVSISNALNLSLTACTIIKHTSSQNYLEIVLRRNYTVFLIL